MLNRVSRSLHVVMATASVLALAACGGDEVPDREVGKTRAMPSVARDPGGLASVAPTKPPPGLALEPEPAAKVGPEAVVKEVATRPAPVALDFDGHITAGKQGYDAGEYRLALAHFEQAAVIKPKQAGARVHVARTLLALGEQADARSWVEQALERDPTSSSAWNTLGRIELVGKDLDAAVVSFRRAGEEDPESSHAWNNLGYALMALGQYEEAAAALENATAGSSPTGYMWNNLGMAYEHVDRIREARAAYRQAASLGSGKGEVNMARLEGVRSLKPADDAVAARGEVPVTL